MTMTLSEVLAQLEASAAALREMLHGTAGVREHALTLPAGSSVSLAPARKLKAAAERFAGLPVKGAGHGGSRPDARLDAAFAERLQHLRFVGRDLVSTADFTGIMGVAAARQRLLASGLEHVSGTRRPRVYRLTQKKGGR